MRSAVISLAALVAALTAAVTASAQTPAFANGPAVAKAMERHFNGTAYKRRLAEAEGKVVSRILCAHDSFIRVVECTGRLRIQRTAVAAEWRLEKRTARRAKLTWTFEGGQIFEYDSEIVAPSAFKLRRF